MRGKLSDGSWCTPFIPKFSDHTMRYFTEGSELIHHTEFFYNLMGEPWET